MKLRDQHKPPSLLMHHRSSSTDSTDPLSHLQAGQSRFPTFGEAICINQARQSYIPGGKRQRNLTTNKSSNLQTPKSQFEEYLKLKLRFLDDYNSRNPISKLSVDIAIEDEAIETQIIKKTVFKKVDSTPPVILNGY